ncbi:MAG: serine/threonine protein phosphatase [Firmicutes bacterium]|nr:serine/threonine protein phosphatase [Bacillota bacterium]
MEFYLHQIDKALAHAVTLRTADYPRIVLFSDCHRGCGTWNDGFLPNKTLYEAALRYYLDSGFTYIELGDGDELWENRKLRDIAQIHQDVFQLLERFYLENRLYLLWGNHDHIKAKWKEPVFYESLLIKGQTPLEDLLLIHGHQADLLNNQLWKLARFLVRYLWKPLELAGVKDPTSAAKNYTKKNKLETRMVQWVKTRNTSLIAGHTHRPVLNDAPAPSYYNTGSCVHPNTITCLELIEGHISLIKWTTCVDENRYLYVCRQTIGGPKPLSSVY